MITAVKAHRLIDGTGADLIENAVVVVEGERIREVGPAGAVRIPAGAEVIDLGDRTLMPGMVDAHTHLTINPGKEGLAGQLKGLLEHDSAQALRGARNSRLSLASGVTTMRITGEEHFTDVHIKRAIQSGVIPGPHLVVATRGLTASGGHGSPGWYFDGPDAIRKAIRENIRNGADFIKILISDTSPTECTYSVEEIQAAVEEAHRWNKRIAAHAMGTWDVSATRCAEAGVDTIEHTIPKQGSPLLDLYIEKGTWLVRTFTIFFQTRFDWGEFQGKSVAQRNQIAREIVDRTLSAGKWENEVMTQRFLWLRDQEPGDMANAVKSGVRFCMGMDSMHGLMPYEMESLRNCGVPAMKVIQGATLFGAEACGLGQVTGSLEAGKWADLIAVKGNPLEDMTAMAHVDFVMKQGARCDQLSIL